MASPKHPEDQPNLPLAAAGASSDGSPLRRNGEGPGERFDPRIDQTNGQVPTTATVAVTPARPSPAKKTIKQSSAAEDAIAGRSPGVLEGFHPVIQTWFHRRFKAPTDAQAAGWPIIRSGRD